jgi:hypothetical protein
MCCVDARCGKGIQWYEATHNTMHTPPPCLPFTLEGTSDKHDEKQATALAKLPCWLATLKDLHTTTRQAMWKLRTEEKQEMGRKCRKQWQRVLAKTPKKTYKHIFRKVAAATTSADGSVHDTRHMNTSTVRDPVTFIRTSDPVAVLDNATTYFKHRQAHVGGQQTWAVPDWS